MDARRRPRHCEPPLLDFGDEAISFFTKSDCFVGKSTFLATLEPHVIRLANHAGVTDVLLKSILRTDVREMGKAIVFQ